MRIPIAALLLVALAVPFAHAHEEQAIYALSVLDDVTPDVDGLDVRIEQSVSPVLMVRNRTAEALVVLDESGEVFLKIGKGRTEAWLDPRIRFDPETPAHEWVVPARLGARHISISGHFESLENHGHFVTFLDVVSPPTSGLEIKLLDGQIPALFVRNESDFRLVVRGREDEPFLRIGGGQVAANVRSPTYYLAGTQTIRSVPPRAHATANPVWKRISDKPVWVFLEYRARVPKWNQERAELGTERKTVLSWGTPATLGGQSMEISGHVEWVPPRSGTQDDGPSTSWLWAGIATGTFVGAFLWWLSGVARARSAATR